jgi:uncharacterized protein (DUF2062 family)
MIIQKLQQFGKNLLHAETSVCTLTRSTCLGIFIAFSPFVGLHTFMAIGLAWLLSFNISVTLMVSCLINNPWTMVPVYGCDYMFGKWVCCFWDVNIIMPQLFLGLSSHSIWIFFIGGNILSILLAIVMYFPIRWLFEKFAQKEA